MGPSIERARRDVEAAFAAALALAESHEQGSFFEFERELWTRMLAIGRAVVALLFARCSSPRVANYMRDGTQYDLAELRTTSVGTLFGKVAFTRPVGRSSVDARAAADLPLDRELRLCGAFSPSVVMEMTRLCSQMAFAAAREMFCRTHGWTPSPRAVLRMVDAVGDAARPFLEHAPAPEDDGEILVIQVDGRGAPMISEDEHRRRRRPRKSADGTRRHARRLRRRERPRKRRTKGKKSKNAKVAVVGVLYTLRRTEHGFEGPIHKRLIGTFEGHAALFAWLHREALKRGYGEKRTIFIADGCNSIWHHQQQYFPKAEPCIDWFHVVEKLWSAGESIHPEGSAKLTEWVAKHTALLRRGRVEAVIGALADSLAATPKTGPGNKGKRLRIEKVLHHFEKHQARMPYAAFRRADLDIGSGAVEGAVRNLIAIRLDGPGMRWSRGRSERLLQLRCILLNGQWDDFAHNLAAREPLRLRPREISTQPHAAAKAAA
jgi:hypothetical protein